LTSRTSPAQARSASGRRHREGPVVDDALHHDGRAEPLHARQGGKLLVPQDLAFLELLRAAVAAGEASATDLAYLEDRVRIFAGRPQLYGTQFLHDDQGLRPEPIEDPEHLDQRRASVGLGPFAEYEARMGRRH
jgi:hypothetical protein